MSEQPESTESLSVPLEGIDPLELCGERDRNLRTIERALDVSLALRNGALTLLGDRERLVDAERVIRHLVDEVRRGRALSEHTLDDVLSGRLHGDEEEHGAVLELDRKVVRARSAAQARYLAAVAAHDIVFGIGPAGTGKTYLAVAMAVSALKQRDVDRIVLARPAVEAGEKLGYLPGDLQEKVDPYLRPLYDALSDVMSWDRLQKLVSTNVIEIVPLAFMRGRTLARSFVILDEAQNATLRQMKMFLTRLGVGSRAVITGDVTQIDLPNPATSGLVCIQPILKDVDGVAFVYMSEVDVVRHRLVKAIIEAFDRSTPAETE